MRTIRPIAALGILVASTALYAEPSFAQRTSTQTPTPSPSPTASASPSTLPPPASVAPVEVPQDLLRAVSGGLTNDQVGVRAASTSYASKAALENLRSAAARVDQAWSAFLPRITALGRYTRVSNFTPPNLFDPSTLPPAFQTLAGGFPVIVNNYLLQASIAVPISDYFLRIAQGYTAAGHTQDAALFDTIVARAKAEADGRVSFYNWLLARGSIIVAINALNDQKTHLNDARNQFDAGNASRVDVLRGETAVAAAELQVERTKNFAALAEKQLRIALHAEDSEPIVPGEALDTVPPPFQGNLKQLTSEATRGRLELKSMDASLRALKDQTTATHNAGLPQISAFADGIYANPNPRRIPAANEWFPTWDVGAQIMWSPNDTVAQASAGRDMEARIAQLEAQRDSTRDGIELEVTQAFQATKESDVALESTKRELASAEEAYRVARELFNNGRVTSSTLTDAEAELTRARLDALTSSANARIARIRLEHALGRDARR